MAPYNALCTYDSRLTFLGRLKWNFKKKRYVVMSEKNF